MRNFGDYLTVTFGLLMLVLSGACTFSVAVPIVFPRGAGEFQGLAMAPVVAVFGGAPMAAGAALAAAGLLDFKEYGPARWARQALLWLIAALGALATICFGATFLTTATAAGGLPAAVLALGFGAASAWVMVIGARAALAARLDRPKRV